MSKYIIDGKEVSKVEADSVDNLNNLYMRQAESGNLEALKKIKFIFTFDLEKR